MITMMSAVRLLFIATLQFLSTDANLQENREFIQGINKGNFFTGTNLLLMNRRETPILLKGGATKLKSEVHNIPDKSSFPNYILGLLETIVETALIGAFAVGWNELFSYLNVSFWANEADSIKSTLKNAFSLALWTIVVFLSGVASVLPNKYADSLQTFDVDNPLQKDWYDSLKKPSWNPPQWAFPVAWIPLKVLQVFSLTTLFKEVKSDQIFSYDFDQLLPVFAYLFYKSLGDTWNKVWFGRKQLANGVAIIITYWFSLVGLLSVLFLKNMDSFYLMLPTLPWVSFASVLNIRLWQLNRSIKSS